AAPLSTFEEMYKASDELETLLIEARFTDPRTVQKTKDLNLRDASYFEYIPEAPNTPQKLPEEFWQRIASQIMQSDAFHKETVQYIIHAFQERDWTLVQDNALERSLRAQVGRT